MLAARACISTMSTHPGRLRKSSCTPDADIKGAIIQNSRPPGLGAITSRLHIVLSLLLIELTFFLGGRVLILLVLGNKIVHVALCFSELHLIHAFSSIPMKKSFPAEHCSKVLRHPFKHLLNRG